MPASTPLPGQPAYGQRERQVRHQQQTVQPFRISRTDDMSLMADHQKRPTTSIPYARAQDVLGDYRKPKPSSSSGFQYKMQFMVLLSLVLVGCFIVLMIYGNLPFDDSTRRVYFESDTEEDAKTGVQDPSYESESNDNVIKQLTFSSSMISKETTTLPNSIKSLKRSKRQAKPYFPDCWAKQKECEIVLNGLRDITKSVNQKMTRFHNMLVKEGVLRESDSQGLQFHKIVECLQCRKSIASRAQKEESQEMSRGYEDNEYMNEVEADYGQPRIADLTPYFENKVQNETVDRRRDVNGQSSDNRRIFESVKNETRKLNNTKITVILHNTTIVEKDSEESAEQLPAAPKKIEQYRSRQSNASMKGGPSQVTNARQIILPTAETSKTSQQTRFSPQSDWPPMPVCFLGAPPSSSSNSYQQLNADPPSVLPYTLNQGASQSAMNINSPQFKQNLPGDMSIVAAENFPPPANYLLPSNNQPNFHYPSQVQANQQGFFLLPPSSASQPQLKHRESYNMPIFCTYATPNRQQQVLPPQQQLQPPQQNQQTQHQQQMQFTSSSSSRANEKEEPNRQSFNNPDYAYDEEGFANDCDGFRCFPSSQCVLSEQRCNGRIDCHNAMDEIGCPTPPDDYAQFWDGQGKSAEHDDDVNTPKLYTRPLKPTTQAPETSETTTAESEPTTEKPIETTVAPTIPIPTLPPHFLCKRMIQTIPLEKRCDGEYDCEDASDEDDCQCKDYLKGDQEARICDGHVDCADGSDEENCGFCSYSEFYCYRSGNCISMKKRCDDVRDCKFGEDETDCFALTDGENVNLDMDKRPHLNLEGVLTKYEGDAWRTTCVKPEFRNDTRRIMVGQKICEKLGFKNVVSIKEVVVRTSKLNERPATKDSSVNYEYPPHYTPLKAEDGDKTCYGIYVRCKPILNHKLNEHLRVDQKTQSRNYTWPWEALIFVNGEYRCSALLLDKNLLLSTSKCGSGIDPRKNYTAALMGTHVINFPCNSPYQQVSTVTDIKPLKNSDASIFILKDSVNMTRYVQPMYLEKSIFPASVDDTCVAIGVNEKNVRKAEFLQSVVDNCPKCHRCYIEKTESACPKNNETSNWSGSVACLSKGGWYPAAVFQDRDESCGFGSKQILNSIDFIHAHLSEAIVEGVEPYSEPQCDGIRCSIGQCIPWDRVCDGAQDCQDGIDENEAHCQRVRDRCAKHELDCRCGKSELRCNDGQCLPKEKFCNGVKDCSDGSDETDQCTCADYLRLTEPKRLCDGRRHCYDKSDESYQHCMCKDSSFHCSRSPYNGTVACIAEDLVCDGHPDCPQGEDEKDELCWTIKSDVKDGQAKGEVMHRTYGVLQPECFPRPILSHREVTNTCNRLGYASGMILSPAAPSHAQYEPRHDFYMVQVNNYTWITMRADESFGLWREPRTNCYRVFVHCF